MRLRQVFFPNKEKIEAMPKKWGETVTR